ncbi:MAG: hypothetical protein DMD82_13870 [Candidatus Rokuibacteriota bacterium]|nr:MAG: hypothetical protein DMD82_13870 [Candidatus Rokubacteria bacterium]
MLLVLVAAILVIERPDLVGSKSRRDAARDPRMLLPVAVDQLGAIEIARAGSAGAWFYHGVHAGSEGTHSHTTDPALAERIAHAFAAFGRTRIERQFTIGTHAKDYGVATPETIILVYRPRDPQPFAQYAVGDIAPDRLSRYVLVVGSPTVATIPNYQIENLSALIAAVGGKSEQGRASGNVPARRGAAARR